MNIVEFPGLGISLDINPVAIQFGNISIYWYGVIIAAAFLTAVLLSLRSCEKHGIKQEDFVDLVLFAAPAGIIGARIYYVIFSWDNYRDNLSEVYKLWNGGLAIYGAVIAGIGTAYIFAKAKKIKPLKLIDFAVPYLVLAQGIGRWGNFINQEAFGSNTNLPWGMTSETIKNTLYMLQLEGKNVIPDMPVHPTFLYESLWDLVVFAILILFTRRKKVDGQVTFLYMALYGLGRFFIEGMRLDSLMLGNLRISQVLAAVFVIVFAGFFYSKSRGSEKIIEDVPIGASTYGNVLNTLREEEEKHSHDVKEEEAVEEKKEADTDQEEDASGDDGE